MNNQNFQKPDLRGKSFKGQTLTDTDFSGADLRGVDFSGATLTRVKFNNAIFGRTWKAKSGIFLLQQIIGFIAGFFISIGVVCYFLFILQALTSNIMFLGSNVSDMQKADFVVDFVIGFNIFLYTIIFSLLHFIIAWIYLRYKSFYLLFKIIFIEFSVLILFQLTRDYSIFQAAILFAMALLCVMGIVIGMVVIAGTGVATGVAALATTGIIALLTIIAGSIIEPESQKIIKIFSNFLDADERNFLYLVTNLVNFISRMTASIEIGGIISFLLLGLYLSHRAIRMEEMQLDYIRHLKLRIESLFCTNFSSAVLVNVNFEGVDLRGIRFSNAKMIGCNFKKTKNHHLAMTTNTPLSPRKVRNLVIHRNYSKPSTISLTLFEKLAVEAGFISISIEKDFSNLDLQGLDFSGMDLSGFDFSNSNISFANFEGCILQDANLAEVTALGTNFSRSTLTGACIKNWNIDKKTQFQGVQCDFVYLDSEKQQRNPPEGNFAADEFCKLYQQVSGTIDFVARNLIDLEALIQAIKNKGGDVQGIQKKEDSIVVTSTPPVGEKSEEFYKNVITEKENVIQQLQHNNDLLKLEVGMVREKNESLTKDKEKFEKRFDFLLEKSYEAPQSPHPINIFNTNQLENNVRTFSGNNNQGVILGDITNSTVTQKINQNQAPAVENSELQAALQELQTLIAQLPAHEQKEAQEEAKKLEQAVSQPQEEQESTVRKTVRYFKGLATELGNLPEIGIRLGTVVAQIVLLMGVK